MLSQFPAIEVLCAGVSEDIRHAAEINRVPTSSPFLVAVQDMFGGKITHARSSFNMGLSSSSWGDMELKSQTCIQLVHPAFSLCPLTAQEVWVSIVLKIGSVSGAVPGGSYILIMSSVQFDFVSFKC